MISAILENKLSGAIKMQKTSLHTSILICFLLSLTACLAPQAPPTPTPVPISPSTPIPLAGLPILFQETFENTQRGWLRSRNGSVYEAEYVNGEMFLNKTSNLYGKYAYARPGLTFDNFLMEVGARWCGGAVGGHYGVMFRYQDDNNYYMFLVGNDGRFSVEKVTYGDHITFHEGFSDVIDRNGGVNRLRIETVGAELRLFINDQFISGIYDTDLATGEIVLVGWLPEGAEFFGACFDNLTVTQHP